MTRIQKLHEMGQAVWHDGLRRSFLEQGILKALIDEGVTGVASNLSVFQRVIAGSADYDDALKTLYGQGMSADEIIWTLLADDVRRAADLLRPIYDRTDGADGYVSLAINPALADKTIAMISEARRLSALLERPNVLIGIPTTPAGIAAIETVVSEGISVDAAMIFSVKQYEVVAQAYLTGMEKLIASGGNPRFVVSVASIVLNPIDGAVGAALEERGIENLDGSVAIAIAGIIYRRFKELIGSPRWESLAAQGSRMQRLLWTGTCGINPVLPDMLYVDGLIGLNTITALVPATLRAFLDHGTVASSLDAETDLSRDCLARSAQMGVDVDMLTRNLLHDRMAALAACFKKLTATITQKCEALQSGQRRFHATLGSYQSDVDAELTDISRTNVINRIWRHDHTVWKPEPTEIANRLGWLHIADAMKENIPRIRAFVDRVRADGITQALLMGMGGSSLAPEVFRKTFGVKKGYLDLAVLDSTDPGAVLEHAERLDPDKTLFIVSTKSGGTVETASFFKFFYNRAVETLGAMRAGRQFIAITDPGSSLADEAHRLGFRRAFLNEPAIGGRYSALSYFGLVPAALVDIDLDLLLERAMIAACNCDGSNSPVEGDNEGGRLGVIMGSLAKRGRDKVTLITSPRMDSFGDWAEQLIAESTGKEGKGILPVVGESVAPPETYGADRLFIYLKPKGDDVHDAAVRTLEKAGYPIAWLRTDDLYDLGGQFFLWEFATAVAGSRLNINPFDQPNVEAAKVLARDMVKAYREKGKLPELTPTLQTDGIAVYADFGATTLDKALQEFLSRTALDAPTGRSYVAIQAYVKPGPDTDAGLHVLRARIREKYHTAVTTGYGPRFLHSTGQLHKGDAGHGLFVQITSDMPQDAPIPDKAGESTSSMTFGVLKNAQALGDRQALLDAGRSVIRFHLGSDVVGGMKRLAAALDS